MWFVISFLLGVGLLAFVWWLRSRDIKLTWYEWLIGILGLVVLLFGLQNLVGSFAENEPEAAWVFLYTLVPAGLIIIAIALQLVVRRQRTG